MRINDFIKGRNVKYDTIRRYIKRNAELFEGHLGDAKAIDLDEVAIKILEEKYPLPQPIQIVDDPAARKEIEELRKQLNEAQALIIRLQQREIEAAPKLLLAEQTQAQLDEMIAENEALRIEIEELKEKKAEEPKKTFFDRLLGR